MSDFISWRNRFEYSVSYIIWEYFATCLDHFGKMHREASCSERLALFDLSRVLCPELILFGYLDLEERISTCLSEEYELVEEFFEDSDPIPATDFFNNPLVNIHYSISKQTHAMMKAQCKSFLQKIPWIEIKNPDDLQELKQKTETYLDWKLSNGDDRNFCAALGNFFSAPLTDKDKRPVTLDELLQFTIGYMTDGLKEEDDELADETEDLFELSKKYRKIKEEIQKEVVCQDTAVGRFMQGIFKGEFRPKKGSDGPKACFLFVGPPGVGKTFLASTAAKCLGIPSKTFHMSEYADSNGQKGLVGFESSYKDAKKGVLTDFVDQHSNAVLIFDEIEKAHVTTVRLFLSVLEGGILRDLYTERDVDFSDTIIIFTTNAGRKFYETKRGMSISSLSESTLIDALGDERYNEEGAKIPKEILSRLAKGNIIGFDHMDPPKLIPLIRSGMRAGAEVVEQKLGIKSTFDETVLPYLFLYHMGDTIDARVANARSKAFITDSVYKFSERLGESRKDSKLLEERQGQVNIRFTVAEKDALAEELTVPDRKARFLVVCNQTDLNSQVALNTDSYKMYHVYAEKEKTKKKDNADEGYQTYIKQQLLDHEIDAILLDPYMREEKNKEEESEAVLSGLSNMNTRGLRVLEWLTQQDGIPPIYCIEMKKGRKVHAISPVDEQDLKNSGVRAILRLSEKSNKEDRTRLITQLSFELFLARKLDEITSKGKHLSYEMGYAICDDTGENEDGITVELRMNDFALVRSMNAEAQEIFIDDKVREGAGFDSVIGNEAVKAALRHFLDFLNDPAKYRRSGLHVSKGLLMYGPPGTGKTLLARALACEADCPFISVTGSSLADGSRKISDIFTLARKYSPSIVFIDEIEAIAQNMGNPILKNLLTEMDGFSGRDKPVFVIAATNAASAPHLGEQNIFLDPALLRRFTKKVYMKYPTRQERIEFLRMKQKKQKGKTYNLDSLTESEIGSFADMTAGRSLAEIENVLALVIGRAADNNLPVTLEMIVSCFEETIYGEQHRYAPDHLWNTAIHEAGHAFLGFMCNDGTSNRFLPEYATIIARGSYLGMVRQKAEEALAGYTKKELLSLIRINLAGRCAEMVFSGMSEDALTTGASSDLETATIIAENLLSHFGMEEGFLAVMSAETMMKSPLAEKYFEKLNEILTRELKITIGIIEKNRDKVEALAKALLDKARLDTNEMRKVLGIKAVRYTPVPGQYFGTDTR